MTEEEIKRHLATCYYAMMSSILAVGKPEDSLAKLATEIHRLRAELESVRADRHDLWQFVDQWADRMYCELKGIEQ